MTKNAIVTLADSTYYEMLIELINSINKYKESSNVDICVLDAGLSKDQLDYLANKVREIKKAEWDIKVPEYKVKGKNG